MSFTSRAPNTRSLSAFSHTGACTSPPLSASSLSTPSITDDQDAPQLSMSSNGEREEEYVVEEEEEKARGRSTTVDHSKNDVDPRNMSPRRNSDELEQLGSEAKARLEEQARNLQSGLLALLERVEKVREAHDKLEGENRFLQEYIGSLMATSKITGSTSGSRNSTSGRLR